MGLERGLPELLAPPPRLVLDDDLDELLVGARVETALPPPLVDREGLLAREHDESDAAETDQHPDASWIEPQAEALHRPWATNAIGAGV